MMIGFRFNCRRLIDVSFTAAASASWAYASLIVFPWSIGFLFAISFDHSRIPTLFDFVFSALITSGLAFYAFLFLWAKLLLLVEIPPSDFRRWILRTLLQLAVPTILFLAKVYSQEAEESERSRWASDPDSLTFLIVFALASASLIASAFIVRTFGRVWTTAISIAILMLPSLIGRL